MLHMYEYDCLCCVKQTANILQVFLVAVGAAAVVTMIPTRILPRSLLSLSQQRPQTLRCSKIHMRMAQQLSARRTSIHMQLAAEETGLASRVSRGATHLGNF